VHAGGPPQVAHQRLAKAEDGLLAVGQPQLS
jgi:hypothetical protein